MVAAPSSPAACSASSPAKRRPSKKRHKMGYAPAQVPLVVGRLQDLMIDVELVPAERLHPDFIQVRLRSARLHPLSTPVIKPYGGIPIFLAPFLARQCLTIFHVLLHVISDLK